MRKLVLMLVIASLSLSVSAQEFGPKKKQKENTFSMGVIVGGNLSTMTQPDECDLYDGSGFGYSGGVEMNARFGRASKNAGAGTGLLGLGLELKYKPIREGNRLVEIQTNFGPAMPIVYVAEAIDLSTNTDGSTEE